MLNLSKGKVLKIKRGAKVSLIKDRRVKLAGIIPFLLFLLVLLFFSGLLPFNPFPLTAHPCCRELAPATLYLEGKSYPLQNPLIQRGGITFAPFREIFTLLGGKIDFTAIHGRLLVRTEVAGKNFLLERGTTAFYDHRTLFSLPAAPFTREGTFYFPLRFLLEGAGYRLHLELTAEDNSADAPEGGRAHLYLYRLTPEDPEAADAEGRETGGGNFPFPPPRFNPPADRVPVLMYHHLVPADELRGNNGAVISVEAFAEQMAYLFAAGYRTVTLEDLYLFIRGEKELPPRSVVLTFDDGYASNYHYAYPLLKQYHFQAVQFPITGKATFWVPCMTEEMMAASADVFEFHSHSHNLHYYIDGRPALLMSDEETIREDLRRSREKLGCFAFAYPYGAFNEGTIALLKETGYKMAFTIRPGYVRPGDDPFRLKRLGVYPETTLKDFIWLLENFN